VGEDGNRMAPVSFVLILSEPGEKVKASIHGRRYL
jgi:hypothetical protein